MRILGLPLVSPQTAVNRLVSDVNAVARLARSAPAKLDRMLELGEEIATIGREVLEIAERLDRRAESIMTLGERLDGRATDLITLGEDMRDVGVRIDSRGAEIVDRATRVSDTGAELIGVLPAFERAIEMATPLEGAIDRFGRLVDRLPGGAARRRAEQAVAGLQPHEDPGATVQAHPDADSDAAVHPLPPAEEDAKEGDNSGPGGPRPPAP